MGLSYISVWIISGRKYPSSNPISPELRTTVNQDTFGTSLSYSAFPVFKYNSEQQKGRRKDIFCSQENATLRFFMPVSMILISCVSSCPSGVKKQFQSLSSSQYCKPFLLAFLMHAGSSLPLFPPSCSHSVHALEGERENVFKDAKQLTMIKMLPNRTQR